MFTVVVSKKDLASLNIYEALKRFKPDIHFLICEEDIINVNTGKANADYFIFTSHHRSEEDRKTLSVHLIGNWNRAEFGGKERKLCAASSHLLKKFFIELNKQAAAAQLQYECTLEATHHGPYCEKPCIFIEIGSSETEWRDKQAAEVVAKTILEATKRFDELEEAEEEWKTALAFGGGHYCTAFNNLELNSNYALSHICSKYNLLLLTEEMIKQAIEVTEERVELALLDWKGLAGEKEKVLKLLENVGLAGEKL